MQVRAFAHTKYMQCMCAHSTVVLCDALQLCFTTPTSPTPLPGARAVRGHAPGARGHPAAVQLAPLGGGRGVQQAARSGRHPTGCLEVRMQQWEAGERGGQGQKRAPGGGAGAGVVAEVWEL